LNIGFIQNAGVARLYKLIVIMLMWCGGAELAYALGTAYYYRFYNQNGVATVSQSVSQQHIQRGYQVLDHNFNLIKTIPPYNLNADLKQAPARAQRSENDKQQQKIIRAYRNVEHVKDKKKRSIDSLQKQLNLQYQSMPNC
jgi:hypothetical protein